MKFRTTIMEYLPGDLHVDYEDGSFEWFDGVKLKIISPVEHEGKEIFVFHDEFSEQENPWKEIGKIVEFEFGSLNDLEKWQVFTTGLKNLSFKPD